jgi:hypothetical protein
MTTTAKPKHVVLQEFVEILFEQDPMKLKPPERDAYETEALSILSRYTEMALQLADEQGAIDAASGVVQQTFEFWFDDIADVDFEQVTLHTLKAYLESYPLASIETLAAMGMVASEAPQRPKLNFIPMDEAPPKPAEKPGVQKIMIGG